MLDNALTDLVALAVMIDPIGNVPVFLGITGQRPAGEISRLANQSVLVAGGILLGFLVLGQVLLTAMHVSMDSFQVGGGLVLFLFALTMIFGKGHGKSEDSDSQNNLAVFPLGMPTIAGPGAILTIVVLTDNDRYNCLHQARTAMVLVGVLFVQWLLFRAAVPIQRRLGVGLVNVLTRVMGLILAAVSVETVTTGLRGILQHVQ